MEFNITKKHLFKGRKVSPSYCPTALAIKEGSHRNWDVRVGSRTVHLDNYFCELPSDVQGFVRDFDKGKYDGFVGFFRKLLFRSFPFSLVLHSSITSENILESELASYHAWERPNV